MVLTAVWNQHWDACLDWNRFASSEHESY